MTNTIEKITELEKQINSANNFRQQAISREEIYTQQKETVEKQLLELGIKDVKEIDKEIQSIDDEIAKLLEEVEKTIPMDVLEKYAAKSSGDTTYDSKGGSYVR